jgi:ferredoxin-NADP reductase
MIISWAHTNVTGGSRLPDHGFHPLPVVEVVTETPDTRSFVLAVPPELRSLFRYQAGQFCTFRVTIDGEEHLRCYSMSSAPGAAGSAVDPTLTVTVKRVPDGLVSNWLNDRVAVGDVLSVTRPAGVFCLRPGATTPVVAFCGGSGVTPVMSLARVVLGSTSRPLSVLYANRDRGSVIFSEPLADLAATHADRFRLAHHVDAEAGYPTPATITAVAGDGDADYYVCGPAPFMDLVEKTLLDLGVPEDQIWIERFTVPPSSVTQSPAAGEPTGKVTLVLSGKRTTIDYRPGDTILETARRAGLRPPFSCEAGNCATCMALVRDGAATLRTNNALTEDELTEGWILTCQALPKTPTLTADYDA